MATKLTGPRNPGLPAFVGVPYSMSIGLRPGYFGGNYLGVQHDPFEVGSSPDAPNFRVKNLNLPKDLTIDRLEDRRRLQRTLDSMRRDVEQSGMAEAMDRFDPQAVYSAIYSGGKDIIGALI